MNNFKSLFGAIALLFLISCTDDEVSIDPTEGMVKIHEASASSSNTKVELWANEDLFVGYNQLFVRLIGSDNQAITEATVTFHPMMTMTSGMSHSAPVDNPASSSALNTIFSGAVNFIMPSGDMGSWKLMVHTEHDGLKEEAEFNIVVSNPNPSRMFSFKSMEGTSYFVSYLFPEDYKVGSNEIEIMINKRENMESFPPVTDFEIIMEPEMPSMGHGSPNNVNPVHEANGHYRGKVNFTMTGDWRINLVLNRGELSKEMYFDITLN